MTDNQTKTNSKKIASQKKELQELQELSLDEMQRVMGGRICPYIDKSADDCSRDFPRF